MSHKKKVQKDETDKDQEMRELLDGSSPQLSDSFERSHRPQLGSSDVQPKGCSIEDRMRTRRMSINNRELLIAAIDGNLEKLNSLIKEGVNVNFIDRDGNTPLHWAVEGGDLKVVQLLLSKGARNIKNKKSETPIDLAKRLNKQDILEILEASLDSKSQSPQLPDKQLEHNVNQVPQFLDPNINKISSRQQVQPEQRNDNANIDTQSKQEKRVNAVHGNIYQLKVLMLFLYRGVSQKYSFRLGTEIKEAKKFDDLVFEYTQNDKKVYRLLQVKHKLDESKKITAGNLLNENNGDYSLIKYFLSYQASKKEMLFRDGEIKDVTICTNIDLDVEHLKSAHITVERIEDKDDILNVKSDKKQLKRFRFSEDFSPMLKQKIQDYSQSKLLKTTECSDDEIKDFLNHLVFAVNQPNEEELGKIVKEEIGKEFDFITTENIYNKLFITMLDWLQGKQKGMFLSYEDGKEFFEEAIRGIPIWFGARDPVESFIGRAEQLDNLHRILQGEDKTVITQVISIIGLGGVGKSELARKYINEYSQKYDNKVVWINAESYQTLIQSFRRLACDKLRISAKNANGEEKEISSIVEDVYKFFSNGKSIFVFDNAEKHKSQNEFDNGIDKFLPSLPSSYNRPYILITSRYQKWPKNIKLLQLDVFNKKEAVMFIKKSLNIKNNVQEQDIKELSKKLHLFPLALQQAVAYIRVHDEKLRNVGSEFNISNFLVRYTEKTRELLNFEFPEDSDNVYSKTVLTTWNITLDAIGQKENGNDALQILNVISYLAPENIHIKIVLSLVSDEEKLGSAIELLKQYSMVYLEHEMLNVHRLIQQVTRIKLEEQNREKEILTITLKLFHKGNVDSKSVDHAISVWNYSSKYSELIIEFSHISSYISVELINSIRFDEAYLFGLKVLELLSALPSNNPNVQVGLLTTYNNIAGALLNQGKYDIALKAFQQVFNTQKTIVGPDHPSTLDVKNNIALALFKQDKYNEALKYYREILGVSKIVLGESHPDTLSTKHSIAGILLSQSRYDEALQMLQEIHIIQETTLGENHSQTLNTKNSIANALLNQGKCNEALQMFQEIYDIQNRSLTKNHPSILLTKNNIAGLLFTQGKYSEALQIYKEVLNSEKVVFGENHPNVLSTHRHIAEVLRLQSKYDKALEIFQEVLDKQKGILDADHLDVVNTQYSIALTLDEQGKYSDALRVYQQVLNKRKVILGNVHPDTLKVINSIAVIVSKQGDYDKALQYYQEILKNQKSSLGENHPDILTIKNNMGMALYGKQEYDKALHIFQEVFSTSQTLLPDHPDTLSAKNNIALVLASQKKHDEALKTFREVLESQEDILGKKHSLTTTTRNNIAAILLTEGKHNEALGVLREVIQGHNEVLGPDHPETLRISQIIQSLSMAANDLLIAVKDNNFKTVEKLIKNGGDVNTKDNDNRSLLYYAVHNGNIDIVNILLKNGADITRITNKGNTPLHIATSKGHKEIVEVLLQHTSHDKLNKFINAQTTTGGTTSLHVAAKNGFVDIVKSLLKHGAIYDIQNKESKIPIDLSKDQYLLKLVAELFEDAKNGNTGIISKLKAVKPDELVAVTNARNNQGFALLEVAITNKHTNIASALRKMLNKISDCPSKTLRK